MGFKIHGSQNLCLFQRPGLHREAACFASRWKDAHHQLQPWLGFQGPSSGRPVKHVCPPIHWPTSLLSSEWGLAGLETEKRIRQNHLTKVQAPEKRQAREIRDYTHTY